MTTIIDALNRTAHARPDRPALRYMLDGGWETTTWREYREHVRLAARALISLGVAPGDHITITGYNCPEWFIADLGAIAAGAIPAGIHPASTAEQCKEIAAHCEARVAFVDNTEQLAMFRSIRRSLPHLRKIVLMHGQPAGGTAVTWARFIETGAKVPVDQLDARIAAQRPDDVCTLIYDVGAGRIPKGVMITHRNIVWVTDRAGAVAGVRPGEDVISHLPLSHIAEQVFSLHSSAALGTCVWFPEGPEDLRRTLRDARPHHFFGVPRVWEKLKGEIEAMVASGPSKRRRLVSFARRVGLRGGYASQRGRRRPALYPLADRLVFAMIREELGLDRARTLLTGAAPISRRTLEFFLSLGLPICDVYGMSECTAATTGGTPARYRTGKAGFVLPDAEVRIAPDGEICIRGQHVFKGYYKDSVATGEALDADGWLHSGDVGRLDADGFLEVTSRESGIS